MTITTKRDAVEAAMALADDVAEGRLSPADLEAQATAGLRELVGTVAGEGDPLWDLQCDITRQVLALGGVPADELSEWLAVARHKAGEPVDQPVNLPEPVAFASAAHSPENGDAEPELVAEAAAEPVAEPEPVAPVILPPHEADEYDALAGWQPGNSRRY